MTPISKNPKKIFVLFNCQNRSLIQALQRLLPDSDVTGMSTNLFSLRHERGEISGKVEADAFVFLPNGLDIIGDNPCTKILPDVSPTSLSPIIFRGFHPDSVAVRKQQDGIALLGGLHSQIVHNGYKANLSEGEIAANFNDSTFRELGYYDTFYAEQNRLLKGFSDQGLDMRPAICQLDGRIVPQIKHAVVSGIAIYLQDALKALQYLRCICARSSWCISKGHTRRFRSVPTAIIAGERPEVSLFDLAAPWVEHRRRGLVHEEFGRRFEMRQQRVMDWP